MSGNIPKVLWVVTHDRVRDGKPPMRIEPDSLSEPHYVVKRGGKELFYYSRNCFESIDEAVKRTEKLASDILSDAQYKLNELNTRLRKAKKLAKALQDSE
ncbi:hypothetical protein ACYPKM_02310 [Pseudomonas aeruginosa]